MTRTSLVGLCAILTLSCATGSHRADGTMAAGIARDISVSERECDSPLNGALIGAAIGGSPILVALLRQDGERDLPYVFAALVGAIAGFWIGIGVDEAHCDPEPDPLEQSEVR